MTDSLERKFSFERCGGRNSYAMTIYEAISGKVVIDPVSEEALVRANAFRKAGHAMSISETTELVKGRQVAVLIVEHYLTCAACLEMRAIASK